MGEYTKINIKRNNADKLRAFCTLDRLTIFSVYGTYFMKISTFDDKGCEEFNAVRLTDYGIGEVCHIPVGEEVLPVRSEINIFNEE